MPTYSYACTECGHRFDAQQAFSDDALTECPQCGGRLRKLFGNVGVVFKGSGFYRTDARNEGKRSGAATRSGSTAATGGSTSEGASSSDATGGATSEGASASGTSGSGSTAPAGSSSGAASPGSSGGSAPAAAAG